MVFVCASAQVAVNGSTTREMMDALNICLLLVLAKLTPPPHRAIVRFRRRAHLHRASKLFALMGKKPDGDGGKTRWNGASSGSVGGPMMGEGVSHHPHFISRV